MLDKRGPTRAELDRVGCPRIHCACAIRRLHATWLNSRAIALLGLEAPDFTPPDGANMVRDAAGKLTGLVVGMETWLSDHLPPVTAAESESRARIMSRELAAAGVTAFTDATTRNGPVEVEQFAKLAQSNAICQRVGVMIGGQHLDAADRCEQLARAAGIIVGWRQVHARLSIRCGRPLAARSARARARAGLRLPRHRSRRTGRDDRRDRSPRKRNSQARHEMPRFRIEHGGIITPNYIDRLMAAGVWVVTNPGFIYFRGPKYAAEPGLVPHLYRARSSEGCQRPPGRRDRRARHASQAAGRDCCRRFAHVDRRHRTRARRSALGAGRFRALHHLCRAPRAPRRRRHRA